MNIKILVTTLLLSLALPAAADSTIVQDAFEVALSDLRLPQHESGTIAFKECRSCDFVTRRVGADTRYSLNGKSVKLSHFRAALARVTERSSEAITVIHHLERNQVTAVLVNL